LFKLLLENIINCIERRCLPMEREKKPENLITFKYIIESGDFFGESIPVSVLEEEIGTDWTIIKNFLENESILHKGHKHALTACYKVHKDETLGLMIDFHEPPS
jgi:hypothetical protein